MNSQQIAWLRALDGGDCDGTLNSILLRDDLQRCTMEGVLKFLVETLYNEKKQLVQENKLLSNVLKKHGLYTPENVLL